MKNIKIIEVPSEIGAGTRGSSLGIGALKTAAFNLGIEFFKNYPKKEVEVYNEVLQERIKDENQPHPHAKNFDMIYKTLSNVSNTVKNTLEEDSFPVVLAGDHSSAAGTIAGIKAKYPKSRLGVIWIDAHYDLHLPTTTPSGNVHGMPLGLSLNEKNTDSIINTLDSTTADLWKKAENLSVEGPKLKAEDLVFIAVRDYEKPEENLVKKHNIKNFTVEEVREKGANQVANETLEILNNCDIIYVSFDVDSLDTSYSIGTGTPVENGLTVEEAEILNTTFANHEKCCCWEMVEVNPTLDSKNKMAETALGILKSTTESIKKKYIINA